MARPSDSRHLTLAVARQIVVISHWLWPVRQSSSHIGCGPSDSRHLTLAGPFLQRRRIGQNSRAKVCYVVSYLVRLGTLLLSHLVIRCQRSLDHTGSFSGQAAERWYIVVWVGEAGGGGGGVLYCAYCQNRPYQHCQQQHYRQQQHQHQHNDKEGSEGWTVSPDLLNAS